VLQIKHFTSFFLKFKSYLLTKRAFFWLKAALVMTILDVISCVCLVPFVIMLPKYEGWNFNSGNYLFTTDTK